jgi:hypothetical protein
MVAVLEKMQSMNQELISCKLLLDNLDAHLLEGFPLGARACTKKTNNDDMHAGLQHRANNQVINARSVAGKGNKLRVSARKMFL